MLSSNPVIWTMAHGIMIDGLLGGFHFYLFILILHLNEELCSLDFDIVYVYY